MGEGFDYTTSDVHDWEIESIFDAIDTDTLIISQHAHNELSMDALTVDDVLDAIGNYDEVSKDLPGNPLRRAPGINFDTHRSTLTIRVKVGWRERYYVVITVMAN